MFAVFTFGGMNWICLPSAVFTLPMPFKLLTIGLTDDDEAPGLISIFTGFVRYGELIPICDGIEMVAVDVVALSFFSPKVATVSRSLPPPENAK